MTQHKRKVRSDKGSVFMTDRDIAILTWIGEQYAVRLDQLQWLLGRSPGRGAARDDRVSESAARDVVKRWTLAGWVKTEKFRVHEPFWIWLTAAGLQKVGLPYRYFNLATSRLEEMKHLFAINEVRALCEETEGFTHWSSDRHLAMGVVREKGKRLPHRPDSEIIYHGERFAVEVELTPKELFVQEEILMELMKGDAYREARDTYGWRQAREQAHHFTGPYEAVWYFAESTTKKLVNRARARLLKSGALSEKEAEEIYLYSYPIKNDPTEDEEEDDTLLDLQQP